LENHDLKAPGLKAHIRGNRASGTAATSIGNKVVVYSAIEYVLGDDRCDCAITSAGDDFNIMTSEYLAKKNLKRWSRKFRQLGFFVKFDGVVYEKEHVIFCRANLVHFGTGWNLVKQAAPAIFAATNLIRHFKGGLLGDYLTSLRTCWMVWGSGKPIFWVMHHLFPDLGKLDMRTLEASGMDYMFQRDLNHSQLHHALRSEREGTRVSNAPTPQDREAYARSSGIPVGAQLIIESHLMEASAGLAEKFADRSTWGHRVRGGIG
jgi:hypothetical protein